MLPDVQPQALLHRSTKRTSKFCAAPSTSRTQRDHPTSSSSSTRLVSCRSPFTQLKLSCTRNTFLLFSSSLRPFCSLAAGPAFAPRAQHLQQPVLLIPLRTYASKSKKKMPPKKAVKEEKILLGRPGNSLKSGIVRGSMQCVDLRSHFIDRANLSLPGRSCERGEIDLLPGLDEMLSR